MSEVAEVQKKWVKALRSGEFRQGRGALNRRGLMCCLGVACEVMGVERIQGASAICYGEDGRWSMPLSRDILRMGLLPLRAPQLDGITPDDPADLINEYHEIGAADGSQLFALMNDDLGYTFEDIADYIEITFGAEW